MVIQTQLDFKKYIGLTFSLAYKKPLIILLIFIGLTSFVSGIYKYMNPDLGFSNSFSQTLMGFVILFVLPVVIYYQSKRNYHTTSRLSESIQYEFDEKTIKISGESFNSEMTWEKIYRVREMNNWVLIYQNKIVANIIPKADFGDHLNEFKAIVRLTGIRNNLK